MNEVTAQWLAQTADVRFHQEIKARPIDRFQEERPHLLSLPARPYDTAQVLYRTVNSEGHVMYRQNFCSVPWQRIGELLPLRIPSIHRPFAQNTRGRTWKTAAKDRCHIHFRSYDLKLFINLSSITGVVGDRKTGSLRGYD